MSVSLNPWKNTKNFPKGTRVRWKAGYGSGFRNRGDMTVRYYKHGWCMVTYDDGSQDGHPDMKLELIEYPDILPEDLFHV